VPCLAGIRWGCVCVWECLVMLGVASMEAVGAGRCRTGDRGDSRCRDGVADSRRHLDCNRAVAAGRGNTASHMEGLLDLG